MAVNFIKNTKETIDATPIVDGQVLWTTDQPQNKIYSDNGTKRVQIGGTIEVDNELSTTSTNAVANNVVTNSIDELNSNLQSTEQVAYLAQTTANTAKTNAETAQSTANVAVTKADEAKSTANVAVTKADEAKSTAIVANNNANGRMPLGYDDRYMKKNPANVNGTTVLNYVSVHAETNGMFFVNPGSGVTDLPPGSANEWAFFVSRDSVNGRATVLAVGYGTAQVYVRHVWLGAWHTEWLQLH